MKRITLLAASAFLAMGSTAQIFSDDFESYSVGDYIGASSAQWTTWSGTTGGTEDVEVTDAVANSGSNSIYLSSTAQNGGPQDILLDFGQQYTSGVFLFEAAFYINPNNNGYFNFQGNTTAGQVWTVNCDMRNGKIRLDDGTTGNLAVGDYTDNTWFVLELEADLNIGRWKALVDGVCIGTWKNGVNTIASLNLYPINGSSYYVDDVSFDHSSPTYNLNAAVVSVRDNGRYIAGDQVYPSVVVGNNGTTDVNSFDVTIDYDGNQFTENVTGQTLTTGNTVEIDFTNPVTIVDGDHSFTATISNVNGGSDENTLDDATCGNSVFAVTPAPGKVVVSEEGTGSWCGWCVRGHVFMDQFYDDYGADLWAGVAVHNGDPMTVDEYDTGLGTLTSGYPSAVVDRGGDVDPSGMLPDFLDRIAQAPDALMTNGATWDATTRELVVSVSADFQVAGNDTYKMLCVLAEDSVTGTGSGYNQSNAYAGGGAGEMGGYELLPSPVPASQMVYEHVARAISPSFGGNNTCFPASFQSGEVVTQNFAWTLPAEWDESKIHVIGMLVEPGGRIENASTTTIAEAVQNGFVTGCNLSAGSIQDFQIDDVLNIYPNPATSSATFAITLAQESEVKLSILDMAGNIISSKEYGVISSSNVTVNTGLLSSGVYLVELAVDGEKSVKRLVIE